MKPVSLKFLPAAPAGSGVQQKALASVRFEGSTSATADEVRQAKAALLKAYRANSIDQVLNLLFNNLHGERSPLVVARGGGRDFGLYRIPEADRVAEAILLELLETQPDKRNVVISRLERHRSSYTDGRYEPSDTFLSKLRLDSFDIAELDQLTKKWDL